MPAVEFLRAWRAERVRYAQTPYAMRFGFRQTRRTTREAMIARTLGPARAGLAADPGGPDRYGGPRAFRLLAADLRGAMAKRLGGHLTSFALPLAARRSHDAAALAEPGTLRRPGSSTEGRAFGEASTGPCRSAKRTPLT
jgi:hypothetical protein